MYNNAIKLRMRPLWVKYGFIIIHRRSKKAGFCGFYNILQLPSSVLHVQMQRFKMVKVYVLVSKCYFSPSPSETFSHMTRYGHMCLMITQLHNIPCLPVPSYLCELCHFERGSGFTAHTDTRPPHRKKRWLPLSTHSVARSTTVCLSVSLVEQQSNFESCFLKKNIYFLRTAAYKS